MRTRFGHAVFVGVLVTSAVVTLATPRADAVSCTVTVRLWPGTADEGVRCLEQRLIELGIPGIDGPDTMYDSISTDAVKAFQVDRGLYPDGIVTSVTARQLGLRGAMPPPDAPRVTVIGDSTSASLRWYDEAANNTARYDVMGSDYDLLWSVESCRRLVKTSCGARNDPTTGLRWTPMSVLPLMQSSLRGKLGEAIVIMAGYDDVSITTAIDSIMAEANGQGVSKVFWLNYRLTGSYNPAYQGRYRTHNADLEAAKVRHPNLVVLDWNGYSYAQSASTQQLWFSNDQIHLTGAGGLALARFLKANIDSFQIEQCETSHATSGVPGAIDGAPSSPSSESGFQAIAPTRVLDTRIVSSAGRSGKTGAGHTVTIDLDEHLPDDAEAAVLNVTAVDPCSDGYLTVFACGTQPGTSNVNYVASRTTAGMAITTLTDTRVCIFSSAMTDLVVDLVGVFVPNGALFHSMTPTRWIDTRGSPAQVARIGRLLDGAQIDIPIAGVGGVPIDATAVWINLTATNSPTLAVLQAYPGPCGTPPNTSVVNVLSNRDAATAAIVELGSSGGICVRTLIGQPHVVVDASGWFGGAAPDGRAFVGQVPVRIYDSRSGAPPATGATIALPAGDVAVYNVGAVNSSWFGWVSARPCGATATSSMLNTAVSETTANIATVAPGGDGKVCFYVSTTTHLIVDQLGTFVGV